MGDQGNGVLVIYTGGTIGSLPKDVNDALSPLSPASLESVLSFLPAYDCRDRKITISHNRIRLGMWSFAVPIDSSNMRVEEWLEIARVIKNSYLDYEGFVVLHGTDTLAYTACALSFMLTNLSKPVVITGSQRPIGQPRSDAVQNFVTAIEIAAARTLGTTVIPEVCVFFRDEIYRGCRTVKQSASSFSAFGSPNYPPLGRAGDHVVVNELLIAAPSTQHLRIRESLERNVASLDIFPGMSTELLRNILNTSNLRGVVLQTFGTGNTPTASEFLDIIEESARNGKVIIGVTQCWSGEVEFGLYDTSSALLSRGVVPGLDLTPEAALVKLMIVLGEESDKGLVEDLLQINYCGEQRQSVFHIHFPSCVIDADTHARCVEQIRPMTRREAYDANRLDRALFRMTGLKLAGVKRGRIEMKVYIDLPDANENTPEIGNDHFWGIVHKRWDEAQGAEVWFLPVTDKVRMFVDNRHSNSLTFVNLGASTISWERASVACHVTC